MSSEKIKLIYQHNRTSKGSDMIMPIFLILLVFSIFSYLYTNVQRQLLKTNFDERKCNPRYLFFSGFLNPLDKNPWETTKSNFQKCVSSNTYKDPKLSRDIKQNEFYIKKNSEETKKNLKESKKYTAEIKEQWTNIVDMKQLDLNAVELDKNRIFDKQGVTYNEVAKKSTQLFHVLRSVLIYIQNILMFKLNYYKKTLSIDQTHSRMMNDYKTTYAIYKDAFAKLDSQNYVASMNAAREAVDSYNALTKELEEFTEKNMVYIAHISEGCYQLKYNMDNPSCGTLFPNLNNELIDYYPKLSSIL